MGMRAAMLLLLIGCGASRTKVPTDAAPPSEMGTGRGDLSSLEPADMHGAAHSDMGRSDMVQAPVDMTGWVPDLTPPNDLMPPCGGLGQECCSGTTCGSGLTCTTDIQACTDAPHTKCLQPMNCGAYPLGCCNAAGMPVSIGNCALNSYCNTTQGKCMPCS